MCASSWLHPSKIRSLRETRRGSEQRSASARHAAAARWAKAREAEEREEARRAAEARAMLVGRIHQPEADGRFCVTMGRTRISLPPAVMDELCAQLDPAWQTTWPEPILVLYGRAWEVPDHLRQPLTSAVGLLQDGVAGVEIHEPEEPNEVVPLVLDDLGTITGGGMHGQREPIEGPAEMLEIQLADLLGLEE